MRGMLAVFLGMTVAFLGLGYVRSESGLIHAFDTGLYLQLLGNLSEGRGWISSIVQERQFLAHHFQPILLLLVPFYNFASTAWMLLAIAWLATVMASFLLIRDMPRCKLASPGIAALASLSMFLHPTLSSRMYYSFVPEVLALPVLAFLACRLAEQRPLSIRECGVVCLALLVVGLCKENYWLISTWVAWLFAVQNRKQRLGILCGGTGFVFLGILVFLFVIWMPEHSTLKHYYGLSYFQNSAVQADGGMLARILGAALNMISARSLLTAIVVLLILPCGLILCGNIWTSLAVLPTLALVMAASNDQIHDLTNHYLLGALPFLAVSVATGWERLQVRVRSGKLRFYASVLIVMVPASFTLMHHSGWLFQLLFATERMDTRLRTATSELRETLDREALLLVDGQLQPFFHDFPKVRIIQAFQGNPSPLGPEDLAAAQHIITANDLRELERCDDVKGDAQALVRYDLQNFMEYCRWLKTQDFERTEYIAARLIHLKIKRALP